MAKDFDIYLKGHLTECDLIVYSIPFYDGITVTDRIILEAALNGYILQKFAAVQMESELTAHIDKMIKLCLEKLDINAELNTTAKFKSLSRLFFNNDPVIINTAAVKTFGKVMEEAENRLVLAVNPLKTQISKSVDRVNLPIYPEAHLSNMFKRGFLQSKAAAVAGVNAEQFNQTDYIDANSQTVLKSTLQSFCYQLTFDASAAVEVVALVLGTKICHSLGRWYNSTWVDSGVKNTLEQKFIAAETIASILQEAASTLIKALYPNDASVIVGVSDINISMKRYRLLSEMDDLTLAKLDDMTLGELDYVWLTD